MNTPTQRVLSCGAGVQSTAIGLLMRDGRLPRVDHAIFADTGWEPAAVSRQVDRLVELFAELAIPLHRAGQGNLRADSINPGHRFASVPYYVRNPDGSTVAAAEQEGEPVEVTTQLVDVISAVTDRGDERLAEPITVSDKPTAHELRQLGQLGRVAGVQVHHGHGRFHHPRETRHHGVPPRLGGPLSTTINLSSE
jgi:hypothetical protein